MSAMILIGSVGTASAQDGRPSDPPANSPAGTVYEIPLDDGREDGAPRERAPRAQDPGPSSDLGGVPAGDDGDSPIRSENNFGSSSRVPGAADPTASSEPPAVDSGGRGAARSPSGSNRAAAAAPLSAPIEDGAPSSALTISLLALIAVVGIAVGTGAARTRRQS